MRDWWKDVSRRVKYKAMSFGAKKTGYEGKEERRRGFSFLSLFWIRSLDGWRTSNWQRYEVHASVGVGIGVAGIWIGC